MIDDDEKMWEWVCENSTRLNDNVNLLQVSIGER